MPSGQSDSGAHEHFYITALEYYVSARSALLHGSTRIPGNLLHHAVELLLKGQLSKTLPLQDLKDPKQFGHDLAMLWKVFKEGFPSVDLIEFDSMIKELQAFERIRYPDEILKRGAVIALGFGRGKPIAVTATRQGEPEYKIGIGDIDAFFARLFPLCRINPKAYFCLLRPGGREALTEGNSESKDWLGPLP